LAPLRLGSCKPDSHANGSGGETNIVTERGDEGVARIKEFTGGLGAHSVIEAVGTTESMLQAIRSTRPGGHVGFVGVTHGVELSVEELFYSHVHLHGGPAPVRRFLPELIELIWNRQIDPRARSLTSPCRWSRPPRAIWLWTNAAPSRPYSLRDQQSTRRRNR